MNKKFAALLTLLVPATALLSEPPQMEEMAPVHEVKVDPNTCRYVGIGVGVPHLDLNLGMRKKWENNGIDIGVNAETSSSIQKKKGDVSHFSCYANYLLYPTSSSEATLYAGFGGSAGVVYAHHANNEYEVVGEGNLILGHSFSNKQFVQAKLGIPLEYDAETRWLNPVEGAEPSITVSYGIGF